MVRRDEIRRWRASIKHFDVDSVREVLQSIQSLPLDDFPALRTPVEVSTPTSVLGRSSTFRPRAVLLAPG